MISKIYDTSILKKTNLQKEDILYKIDKYDIDHYGFINYEWLNAKMNIYTLLQFFPNNTSIMIYYYQQNKICTDKIILTEHIPKIRMIYSLFEKKVPYFILSGMIFMNMCSNHIISSKYLLCKMEIQKSLKPLLILSYVFPNSNVNMLNNLIKDSIIIKVNKIHVHSITQFKKALFHPIQINEKEYIQIEDESGKSVILSIPKIIEQDIKFSKDYHYKLNEFHTFYSKKYNIELSI